MNNEKRIFTSGLDFNKLFIIFVIVAYLATIMK